jgi:hypothetical protein
LLKGAAGAASGLVVRPPVVMAQQAAEKRAPRGSRLTTGERSKPEPLTVNG